MHHLWNALVHRWTFLWYQAKDWLQVCVYYLRIKRPPLVSIIINNYNYGEFLGDAIDSALAQRYPRVEVIVVDDGSTDDSRHVIARYGSRVMPILKANGGQASACNVGLERSRGTIVFFLDADDTLLPTAVFQAVAVLKRDHVVKVHWHQHQVDRDGRRTGQPHPEWDLKAGDFRSEVMNQHLDLALIAPTSGNAWQRRYLDAVYPLRELGDRHGADEFLCCLAPLFGEIAYIPEPQGCYRIHGSNHRTSQKRSRLQVMRSDLKRREALHRFIEQYLTQQGIKTSSLAWRHKPNSYYTWLNAILAFHRAVTALVPVGEKFILVDGHQWQDIFLEHQPIPFLNRDGQSAENPPDAATMIYELERLCQSGVRYVVFAWISYWRFAIYPELYHHLLQHHGCKLFQNDRCVIFQLSELCN